MSGYDVIAAGCECWRCPLQGREVVPPEIRPDSKLLLIGRDPGISEEETGRPFAGVFGRQVERSLGFAGASRNETSITNLRICRLPKNSPKDWHALSLDACRPRLLREIAAHPALLLFGADAIHELYGAYAEQFAAPVDLDSSDLEDDPREAASVGEAGLFALRGFPLKALGKPAIATFLAPRLKRWIPVLDSDVAKAIRLANNALDWTEPEIVLDPTISELDNVLERFSRDGQLVITDTETGDPRDPTTDDYGEWAKEPLRAALRCIGLGNRDLGICVPFRSLETPPRRFRIEPRAAIDRLNNFYGAHLRHGGHNINKFDRPLLDRYGVKLPDFARLADTLTGHHVSDSEMPHGLDFLSSRYTDSPKHKPGHKHKWRSDRELHHYCLAHGMPVVMADGSTVPIQEIVQRRIDLPVMSLVGGKIGSGKIVGWHRNRIEGQEWICVRTETTRALARGLVTTPDHLLFTLSGWKRADAVTVRDRLATAEAALSPRDRQAVLGTLLGDTSLLVSPMFRRRPAGALTAYLSGGHTVISGLAASKFRALGFLRLKKKLLAPREVLIHGRSGRGKLFQQFDSPNMIQLGQLRPLLYDKQNRRRLYTDTLDRLGAIGLAWWFMDDGCLQKGGQRRQNTGARGGALRNPDSVCISTQRYPREDVKAAARWFSERFGRTWVGRDRVLRLSSKASEQFCVLISPFVFPA